jgi:hypothetical protein
VRRAIRREENDGRREGGRESERMREGEYTIPTCAVRVGEAEA